MDCSDLATRRSLLGGLGGLVLTAGALSVPLTSVLPAAAQEEGNQDGERGGAAPTAALTPAQVAGFLQSIELAVIDAYDQLRARTSGAAAVGALDAFSADHRAHSEALGDIAGGEAVTTANAVMVPLLRDQVEQVSSDADALALAFDLEGTLASTHLLALGLIEPDATATVEQVAVILPVESQHQMRLGELRGTPLAERFPEATGASAFETLAKAVPPEEFPPAGAAEAPAAGGTGEGGTEGGETEEGGQ